MRGWGGSSPGLLDRRMCILRRDSYSESFRLWCLHRAPTKHVSTVFSRRGQSFARTLFRREFPIPMSIPARRTSPSDVSGTRGQSSWPAFLMLRSRPAPAEAGSKSLRPLLSGAMYVATWSTQDSRPTGPSSRRPEGLHPRRVSRISKTDFLHQPHAARRCAGAAGGPPSRPPGTKNFMLAHDLAHHHAPAQSPRRPSSDPSPRPRAPINLATTHLCP